MTITPPTAVKTSPIQFTAPEKKRLAEAATELARLDALLASVVAIKDVLDSAQDDFAAGRISIREALGLLAASGDSARRADIEGKLRRPVKAAIRQTVADVADLVTKSALHHADQLASKAAALERVERAQLDDLGIGQDDFRPSDLLAGLREQHSRAKATAAVVPARDGLNRLLADI
jgi:hypothetical protein